MSYKKSAFFIFLGIVIMGIAAATSQQFHSFSWISVMMGSLTASYGFAHLGITALSKAFLEICGAKESA